jgi:hypothetical protein
MFQQTIVVDYEGLMRELFKQGERKLTQVYVQALTTFGSWEGETMVALDIPPIRAYPRD